MDEKSEVNHKPTSIQGNQQVNQNGNRSSSGSPESIVSTSSGSTPSLSNTMVDKKMMFDWWKRMSLGEGEGTTITKSDHWMQVLGETEIEDIREELMEELQAYISDYLEEMMREDKAECQKRLRQRSNKLFRGFGLYSKIKAYEEAKYYGITKVMKACDKNQRFEWLNGQFMEDTKCNFTEAIEKKEHSIFADNWKRDAVDYEKGSAIDMNNRLRNEMGRTVEKVNRLFRNTVQELSVNKQADMQNTENSVLSNTSRLSTNCEDRKYYLQNTISEYLTQERQRRDQLLRQEMEKEVGTLRREVAQLKKSVAYGPARRCCASVCTIQ